MSCHIETGGDCYPYCVCYPDDPSTGREHPRPVCTCHDMECRHLPDCPEFVARPRRPRGYTKPHPIDMAQWSARWPARKSAAGALALITLSELAQIVIDGQAAGLGEATTEATGIEITARRPGETPHEYERRTARPSAMGW